MSVELRGWKRKSGKGWKARSGGEKKVRKKGFFFSLLFLSFLARGCIVGKIEKIEKF